MSARARLASLRALPVIAVALGTAGAVVAPPAWGYVRAKTDDGIPIYWTSSCLPVTLYTHGFTMMSPDETAKSIAAAAHTWSPDAVTCPDGGHPYLEIVPGLAPLDAQPPEAGNDGRNVVEFVTSGWQDRGHAVNAVAVTSITKKKDGRILDADIEINAEFETWANRDPGAVIMVGNGQPLPFDLQNAITHEFGHLIGFDHTCFGLADGERQVDDQGNFVLDCDAAPAEVRATVMFANIELETEVSKRVLTNDDIRGVCEAYPAAADPHACVLDLPDDGCGCAAGGAGDGVGRAATLASVAAVAALALALARVRRGRARPADRGPTAHRG